ncbi:par-3 family cell polarity regulator beta a [Xenentodon cancila]
MKVTVTFGDTAVVVPCKAGWTVRDLMDQATRRYRRVLGQQEEISLKIHHLEYTEGGILDMDDLLSDLIEDRDKLVAVFQEDQRRAADSPRETVSNGFSSAAPSPDPAHYYSHLEYEDPYRQEIEVNDAILKANTPLLVRSSSDSALAPPHGKTPTPPPEDQSDAPPETDANHVLKGSLDRLRTDSPTSKMSQVNFRSLTRTVEFPGDRGPLGIHVVPYCSSLSGRTLGLHIKGIEENSICKKENLFREEECIVHINDTPLHDKTFVQSQEVFRQAMMAPRVCLKVLPVGNKPRYEKSLIGQLFTGDGKDSPSKGRSPMVPRAQADPQPEPNLNARAEVRRPDARAKTSDPVLQNTPHVQPQSGPGSLERSSPTPQARGASSSPTSRTRSQSPLATNNPGVPLLSNLAHKKGGKKIKIDLKKGTEGLGFTVVTRDSSVHGPGPILVKNILPRGAAVKDGRLQPGDRILEVNGVDMTGRSQEELVAMLRSTKQGESVCVVVARQEDIFLPRELKGEETASQVYEDGREQLMYEIPLNETGSAGLGLSLKGNKSKETAEDLGIFIKSIIHGGAAYKDGRLSVNDQLIAVNGESLLGRSNNVAMETLRRSMSSEGNARGTIQLVVLRAPKQLKILALVVGSQRLVPNLHQARQQKSPPPINPTLKQAPAIRYERLTPATNCSRLSLAARPPSSPHLGGERLSRCRTATDSASYKGQGRHTPDTRNAQRHRGTRVNEARRTRSHTLDDDHRRDGTWSSSYTENIRAMAGQMWAGSDFWDHDGLQRPSGHTRTPNLEPAANRAGLTLVKTGNYASSDSGSAVTANGNYGHYSNDDEEPGFPPPPSPGTVEEMNRELSLTPPHRSEKPKIPAPLYTYNQVVNDMDNMPRSRTSKSMDLVADESNVGSLVRQRKDGPSDGGALGPTLGLMKSSSLESLQTAVSEAKQSHIQAQVPFHRPRPHMVRGRGCNQSFRNAIDKSYDGPSEDDDDMSDHSSGHDTPASTSSRQGPDADDGDKKKKKTKGKKEKKLKGKKKTENSVEELDKKTKKRFGLLRFGKKKDDKSKDAAKTSKNKLEALSEEELDRDDNPRDGYNPRYADTRSGHTTPDRASLPDVEDDDSDPNYARITNFRQPPSPHSFNSRTPSPSMPIGRPGQLQVSSEDLDGLYAKVNKPKSSSSLQNQQQMQADSDHRSQRLDYQQARVAPVYEELDAARRRVLEYDPLRLIPKASQSSTIRFSFVSSHFIPMLRTSPSGPGKAYRDLFGACLYPHSLSLAYGQTAECDLSAS